MNSGNSIPSFKVPFGTASDPTRHLESELVDRLPFDSLS